LGGDSILSIQVVSRAAARGIRLSPKQLFQAQTLAELALLGEEGGAVTTDEGPVTGPVPLTPILSWYFEQAPAEPHHFNQSVLLDVTDRWEPTQFERVFGAIVEHHDALRLRFARDPTGAWTAENLDPTSRPVVTTHDF